MYKKPMNIRTNVMLYGRGAKLFTHLDKNFKGRAVALGIKLLAEDETRKRIFFKDVAIVDSILQDE